MKDTATPGAQGMKRYDMVTNYRCGESIDELERASDGEWCRYEDVEPILSALKALLERAERELADPEDVWEVAAAKAAIHHAEGRLS